MTSAVCLIAKNEERAIAEWLAYQKAIGFDTIYVYDNDSDDETCAIVEHIAAAEPSIHYRHWPNAPGRRPQTSAYADALSRATTDWLAFFDTDEFLVLHRHRSVNDYLATMKPDVSAIAVNWLLFGSAGRKDAGEGLVIDRFTKCAIPNYPKNRFCKTIVRPRLVSEVGVHSALVNQGRYANGSGNPVTIQLAKTDRVDFATVQLNHYLLKSCEEFLLKKSRGHASRALDDVAKYHIVDETYWLAHDANHLENQDILRMKPDVERLLRQWDVALAPA